MPSKKKKYNARFPPARIKKIMQTDEDVGKVAAAVPIIISKALEMFMESLIMKACENTQARHAKTMTTSHLKKCILQESNFDFLKDLVENVPDLPANEDELETKETKQRKRRAVPSEGRERKTPGRKKKKKESEESDDEPESEDDGESSESHSNTGSASNTETATTSRQLPCPATAEQDDVFETPSTHPHPPAPVSITKLHIPTMFNSMNNQEDDDYDS